VPLLYYWRPDNYARDRLFGFGYHLNQNNALLTSMPEGDSLWAFTRRRSDGLYVLAADLIVRAVTRNVSNYRYGAYRIWGDLERSRYFDIDSAGAANIEPLVRSLSVVARSRHLGQSFQGLAAVRTLSSADDKLIEAFASGLPTLERVAFYPEDAIEARLIHGDPARELVLAEAGTAYNRRMRYLYDSLNPVRARRHVLWLQERYGGKCQICLYDPLERYGRHVCHAHHIQWLSRGGEDKLKNLVLICPNHHAAIHQVDAPFDFADLTFEFRKGTVKGRESLQLNTHLRVAV
jgi:hypothetical protein